MHWDDFEKKLRLAVKRREDKANRAAKKVERAERTPPSAPKWAKRWKVMDNPKEKGEK